MRARYFCLAFILLIAGCASGVTPGVLPPAVSTASRLIIYRPSEFPMGARAPTVVINGVNSCSIGNGRGFEKDVAPGRVSLSTQFWDMPGTSRFSFTASPGQVYYIKFALSSEAWSGMFAGLIGQGIDQIISKGSGPFNIELTDESSLNGIKVGICNL